jgi:Na+/H+ antiporter NhaA
MALFVAQLAFTAGPSLEIAKLAILCGSGSAGLLSLLLGYRFLKPGTSPGSVQSVAEAEASTRT